MNNSQKRILLVDDHADTLHVTAILLRRMGYYVQIASTVAGALRLCDEETFDLLLGDVGLPDGSGMDLMRIIAARCGIKGIAYTAYGYETDIETSRAAGFSAHLLKPVHPDLLLRTVAKVLAESSEKNTLPVT